MRNKTINLLLSLLCIGCTQSTEHTAITVLFDTSEIDFQQRIEALGIDKVIFEEAAIRLSDETMFNGARVRFNFLNELSQSPGISLELAAGKGGLFGENPHVREEEVRLFQKQLSDTIANLIGHTAKFGSRQSKIYRRFCRELQLLTEETAENKVFIVCSDMLENSDVFNLYDTGDNPALDDPEGFAERVLENDCSLPDLSGVDIKIFLLGTGENDEYVHNAERFWRAVFLKKGAKSVTF